MGHARQEKNEYAKLYYFTLENYIIFNFLQVK